MVLARHYVFGVVLSGVVCLPFAQRIFFPPYRIFGPIEKRTIIVTGSTGNFGRCIAAKLANAGQRVIMACRDMDECRRIRRELVYRTENKAIACRYLDLESLSSIDKFVEHIKETEPRVDVLINAAAITKPPKTVTLNKFGVEKTFFVNYVAPFILTHKLLDKLIETSQIAGEARVVNVTGNFSKKDHINIKDLNFERTTYTPQKAYQQSKIALAYFTQLLEQTFRDKKLKLYAFGSSPGFKKLSLSTNRALTFGEAFGGFIHTYTRGHVDTCTSTTIAAAIDAETGSRQYSGKVISTFLGAWNYRHKAADLEAAKAIWNMTVELIGNLKEEPTDTT